MTGELTVSKLDAACRQLETAINLYFNESDPISIHTLAAASYNIIRDINKKRGGSPMFMKEGILSYIKKERQKEMRRKMNEAENFFKHADRDQDKVLKFKAGQTEFLLLEACVRYRDLTSELPPLMELYGKWFMLNNPNFFNIPIQVTKAKEQIIRMLGSFNKQHFFNLMLPIAYSMKKLPTKRG